MQKWPAVKDNNIKQVAQISQRDRVTSICKTAKWNFWATLFWGRGAQGKRRCFMCTLQMFVLLLLLLLLLEEAWSTSYRW